MTGSTAGRKPASKGAAGSLGARLRTAAILLALASVVACPFGEGSALPGMQAVIQTVLLAVLTAALLLRAGAGMPPATIAAAGLVASAIVSSLIAPNLYGAFLRTLDIAGFLAAFLVGGLLLAGQQERLRLVQAVLLAAGTQSLFVFLQFTGVLDKEPVAGTMLNPNHLAALLGVALLLGIGQLASKGSRGAWPAWVLAIPGAAFLILASRGAIAGLAAGGAVMLACLWSGLPARDRRRAVAAGCVAALAAGAMLGWRFMKEDRYRWDRVAIWEASLTAWGGTPSPEAPVRPAMSQRLLGIGPGQFEREAPGFSPAHDDRPVRFGKRLDQTHSDPLQFLVEQGLLGALAGLLLLVAIGRAIASRLREERDTRNEAARRQLAGCAGALTALGVHSLFENLSHRPALVLVAGLIAGVAAARPGGGTPGGGTDVPEEPPGAPGRGRWRLSPGTILGLSAAALVFLACIAGPWLADRHWRRALADPAGGAQELDRAIAINRFQPAYHARRAAILAAPARGKLAPGPFAEAMAELAEAARLDPRNAAWPRDQAVLWRRGFGEIFRDRSSFDASIAAYARAEALDPCDPFTPMQRGTLHASAGEYDEAAAAFARARAIEPNLFAAWILGGRLEQERGNEGEASKLTAEAARRREALASHVPESDNEYEKAVLDWPDDNGGSVQ